MRSMTRLLTLLMVAGSLHAASVYGGRQCNRCQEAHVVRHFHVGPESVCDPISDADEGYVYVENRRQCGSSGDWEPVVYDGCCAQWRQWYYDAPVYDESVNEIEYDQRTHWPGKKETSWMHELDPW